MTISGVECASYLLFSVSQFTDFYALARRLLQVGRLLVVRVYSMFVLCILICHLSPMVSGDNVLCLSVRSTLDRCH